MRYIFDIETDGFLEECTRIHALVLLNLDTGEMISCPPDPQAFLMTIEEGLRELMTADLIVGHNIIRFDIPVIQKLYPWFQPRGLIRDTIVLSRLIYTNLNERDFANRHKRTDFPTKMIGKHALEAWGHRLGEYKGDVKGPWDTWTEAMQTYCEQDTRVTYRLWKLLESKGYSEQAIQLEHDFATILFQQERHGFGFDTPAAQALYSTLCQRRLELEQVLAEYFPPWEERTKFTPKVNSTKYGYVKGVPVEKVKVVHFNPNSRDHIAYRLHIQRGWQPEQFTEDGKPKVDETILETLDWPEAKLIALKGGRCERCLKNFHPSVYEFHHRNPEQKEIGLNKGVIGDRTWAWVLKEADKCHLLCANCHREVHAFDDQRFLEYPEETHDKSSEAGPGENPPGTPAL